MVDAEFPGVFVAEEPAGIVPITGVDMSTAAFVDRFVSGPSDEPVVVGSFAEFSAAFGGIDAGSAASFAIAQFFANGGRSAVVVRVGGDRVPTAEDIVGVRAGPRSTGLYALDRVDRFGLLCIPRAVAVDLDDADVRAIYGAAATYCAERRAILLLDLPSAIENTDAASAWIDAHAELRHPNVAVYFPSVEIAAGDGSGLRQVAPSGSVAGVIVRTDANRGVWKTPAGISASLQGVQALSLVLSDAQSAVLEGRAINTLRTFATYGNVVWGARTAVGADASPGDWKYLPVRRLALFIEQSILDGTRWAAFEPDGPDLWAKLRLSIGAFLQSLFQQGAFAGTRLDQAYVVRCDATTTTAAEVDQGIVNVVVGFAPLRPAEFVVIDIALMARAASP